MTSCQDNSHTGSAIGSATLLILETFRTAHAMTAVYVLPRARRTSPNNTWKRLISRPMATWQ